MPAPRRLDTYDGRPSVPPRSCSVPPNAANRLPIWHARELNVDDGMSMRSESTQSLVGNLISITIISVKGEQLLILNELAVFEELLGCL